jgi:hypothetical protein
MSGDRRSIHSTTSSSLIGFPSMSTRSRKSTRCGEVYRPTRRPSRRRMASSVAQTLPFPFVPAMWKYRDPR